MIYTKILTIITAAAFLTGCQSFGETFKVDNRVTSTVVHWYAVDDVVKDCNLALKERNKNAPYLYGVGGCAIFSEKHSKCVIITGRDTTEYILGHELRHCFQGYFHP